MPAPAILKVLGMTKEQWGQLPSESESHERRDLRAKAMAILESEAKNNPSLADRLTALEGKIGTSVHSEYDRKTAAAIEQRMTDLEKKFDTIADRFDAIEQPKGKK